VCSLPFGMLGNMTVSMSMLVRIRLEYSMALDCVYDTYIAVVPARELPALTDHTESALQPTGLSTTTATTTTTNEDLVTVEDDNRTATLELEQVEPPAYPIDRLRALPLGYTCTLYRGKPLYVDHNARTTAWQIDTPQSYGDQAPKRHKFFTKKTPRYPSPQSLALPAGWELSNTITGQQYLLDHNSRVTCWNAPGTLSVHRLSVLNDSITSFVSPSSTAVMVVRVGDIDLGQTSWPPLRGELPPSWSQFINCLTTPLSMTIVDQGKTVAVGQVWLLHLGMSFSNTERHTLEMCLNKPSQAGGKPTDTAKRSSSSSSSSSSSTSLVDQEEVASVSMIVSYARQPITTPSAPTTTTSTTATATADAASTSSTNTVTTAAGAGYELGPTQMDLLLSGYWSNSHDLPQVQQYNEVPTPER
jgi:hypothetical protein